MRLVQYMIIGANKDRTLRRRWVMLGNHLRCVCGFMIRAVIITFRVIAMSAFDSVVLWNTKERIHRIVITEKAFVPNHTREYGAQGQHAQGHKHHSRALMRMFMRMLVTARRAKECQEHQTPRVKRCEQRRQNQHPECVTTCGAGPCAFNHGIFGQEPCKSIMRQWDTHASDGKRPDHHRPERIRDLFAQTAVIAHVLLVVHCVDDRACP